MKLLLLIKSLMIFLIVFVGCHFVSMPHSNQLANHGKLVAVESVSTFETINLQEDQKHVDFLIGGHVVGYLLVLMLAFTTHLVRTPTKSRRKLKHFLYSVYYQSSYFSKSHLYTT